MANLATGEFNNWQIQQPTNSTGKFSKQRIWQIANMIMASLANGEFCKWLILQMANLANGKFGYKQMRLVNLESGKFCNWRILQLPNYKTGKLCKWWIQEMTNGKFSKWRISNFKIQQIKQSCRRLQAEQGSGLLKKVLPED